MILVPTTAQLHFFSFLKNYKVGIVIFIILILLFLLENSINKQTITGAPPYQIEDLEPPVDSQDWWLKNWKRPSGPTRVGLQVGHWKNDEVPEELERLKGNTGASGGGKAEWEVNLEIALLTKNFLEKEGVIVDILPTTIPQKFLADAFVAIHADGSLNKSISGFKIAKPRRDYSQKAEKLLANIQDAYQLYTKLPQDPNITRNMTGYYAFSWWRYDHSVHPMTPSVILETGFLTNASDRTIIVQNPEISAQGLAVGILNYLKEVDLI